jgi:hypothetical protein
LFLHLFDQCAVGAGLGIVLDFWNEHWFHRLTTLTWL